MSNVAFGFIFAIWIMALCFLPACLLAWMEQIDIELEKELYHERYGEYFQEVFLCQNMFLMK